MAEHPAFTRARALTGPLAGHFPTTPDEARAFQPLIQRRALHRCVLAVARSRIECAWAAYIANVPGYDHAAETEPVLDTGDKIPEAVARALFPIFEGVPYAD
jgi:hypothetical protein